MLDAVAREVAAAWGIDLGEPFALALHSFAAPAGDGAVDDTGGDQGVGQVDGLLRRPALRVDGGGRRFDR